MQLAVEIALALAAAALLVALAVPWPPVPDSVAAPVMPRAEATSPSSAGSPAEIAPGDIEALFVGRPPVAARAATARAAAAPVAVSWLRYLGRSRDPDGTMQVFVKDTRTGAVIVAVRAQEIDGWTLVDEDEASVTLGRDEERYSVPRR